LSGVDLIYEAHARIATGARYQECFENLSEEAAQEERDLEEAFTEMPVSD
jgi:hypothetical protein